MQDLISDCLLSEQDVKNIPNILLMLVEKTERTQLIDYADISNIFQISSGTCKLCRIIVEYSVAKNSQINWSNFYICYRCLVR